MKDRIARLFTDLLAPWVVIIAICLAAAWQASGTVGSMLLWGGVVALFCSFLPMVWIKIRQRRGQVTDIHVHHRHQRIAVMAGIIPLAATGVAIVHLADAPLGVLALGWAMLAEVIIFSAITWWWKISFHTGVSSLAVIVMALKYSPWWLLGAIVIAAIGWSRVHIKDHTLAQITVGAVSGAIITGTVYALI